jgi:hypothetical protein
MGGTVTATPLPTKDDFMAELKTGFDCRVCGQRHATLPLSFSVKAPLAATAVPREQIDSRVVITADQCVIDDMHYYLRGRIVIPIHDCHEPFVWGVWAQVSVKDFYRSDLAWNTPGRENEPPFAGTLANDLSLFGCPAGIALDVHTQIVGRRPHLTIRSDKSPLAKEQREGITLDRVKEIASTLLHVTTATAQPAARPSTNPTLAAQDNQLI